jgi:hypothetical protein
VVVAVTELPQPATLAEAHEVLVRLRPRHDADPLAWVEFHRRSAQVYAGAAKLDVAHRQEASHWAGSEIRHAREIEYRLNPDIDHESDFDGVDVDGITEGGR